jgi:hypothetical protein
VRCGAEEDAIVEARREVADRAGGVAVDRVFGRGRGRGDVGFIEDQQALLGPVAEVGEQRIAVFGPANQRIADDEAIVRGPGIDAKPTLASAVADELTEAGHTISTKPAC